jgi:hypoxanthine-guanine phosphoribosyltransferase
MAIRLWRPAVIVSVVIACVRARYDIATVELSAALRIPDPRRVEGKAVLLVDDVFTTGLTTHVVGQQLLSAGARRVAAVVLARQPFGGGR